MKKLYSAIPRFLPLLLAAALLFCACGESAQVPDSAPDTSSTMKTKPNEKQSDTGEKKDDTTSPEPTVPNGIVLENEDNGCVLLYADGSYSLKLPKLKEEEDGRSTGGSGVLYFESAESFQKTLGNLDFTEGQLRTMKNYFAKNSDGSVKLFDVSRIYQPQTPEGFTFSTIGWNSEAYTYRYLSDDEQDELRITMRTKEAFEQRIVSDYSDLEKNNPQWKTFVKQDRVREDGTSAIVYDVKTDVSKLRYVLWETTMDTGKAYVNEIYLLEYDEAPERVSEEIPSTTITYVEQNGAYYSYYSFSEPSRSAEELRKDIAALSVTLIS